MVGAASHKRDDRERDDRAILIVRSVEILPPVSALLAITPKIFPFLMAKSVPPIMCACVGPQGHRQECVTHRTQNSLASNFEQVSIGPLNARLANGIPTAAAK